MQQEIENKIASIEARLDIVNSHKRALMDEYIPLRAEGEDLTEILEKLNDQLLSLSDKETDARFDELIESIQDDGVKTIEENEAIEMETLIDEIKNPEDYANFDLTQHEE